jgi:hypothetical protein
LTVIECADVPGSYPSPGVQGWGAVVAVVDVAAVGGSVVVDVAARGLLLLHAAASTTHAMAVPQAVRRIAHV